tara:strand:- start:263 stop:763 length:501 start_codon:yes stop_codon:yes gene_type:complete
MGKRSNGFERKERDFYPTIDPSAIDPIAGFVLYKNYYEPCVGDGQLINLLDELAVCTGSSDVEKDAARLVRKDLAGADLFITNPPYSWPILEPILFNLSALLPTLLLLPSDMMHNKRMSVHMKRCKTVWSVGRLYWQENKIKGKDNYCWYLFGDKSVPTNFIGRKT